MKLDVCAYICVYNEEYRIRYTLESFQWCRQIIIVDKNSKDRTREIAKSYGVELYQMENSSSYDVNEFQFLKHCKCEWLMFVTASDIIDPKLVSQIKDIVSCKSGQFDSISIPYHRYVLGIYNKYSPWYSENSLSVFKNNIVSINAEGVHDAISITPKNTCKIGFEGDNALSHLTHETVDVMMERHLRYVRAEGENYNKESLRPAFKVVLGGMRKCLMCIWGGWDGIALMFAFLSYCMLSFIYKWEKKKCSASQKYFEMRETNLRDWEKFQNL